MAIAGDVMIRFSGDFAELKAGLASLQQNMVGLGDSIKGMGDKIKGGIEGLLEKFVALMAVDKVLEFAHGIAELADTLEDTAANLKLTTEEFEALQGAAFLAGQSTDSVQKALEKFNIFIGNAVRGGKEQIETLRELGVNTKDANGRDRDRIAILTELSQKLIAMEDGTKRASYEVNVFGKSGQQVSAILEQWSRGINTVNDDLARNGLLLDKEAREKMAAARDEAEKLTRQNQVLFSQIWAPADNWGLKVINALLTSIRDSLVIIDKSPAWDKMRAALNIASFGTAGAILGPGAVAEDIGRRVEEETKKYNEAFNRLMKLRADGFAEGSPPIRNAKKDMDDTRESITKLQDTLKGLTPKPPDPIAKPDAGGQGGSLPAIKGEGDSFLEQIRKLEEEKKAAQKAIDALLNSDTQVSLRQINVQLETDKKIDEAIAAVSAKEKSGPYLDRIKQLITDTYTLQSVLKELQRVYDLAEQDQAKFGDGQRTLRDRMKDLDRELKTGRLSQDAYAAAVKDANEQQKNQADTLARAKGGFDGFQAGVENAARAFEKNNDAFSMGTQTFNAFTSAMGEGLDVLAGKSSKTFNQIAGDFALMLAKMAAQAAVSTVFKAIFKFAVSSLSGPSIDSEIADWSTYGGNRAAGGGVFGNTSYVVGEHGPEVFTPTVAGAITPIQRTTEFVSRGDEYNELNKTFSNVTNAINDIKTFNTNVSSAVENGGSSSFASSDVRSVISSLTSRVASTFNSFASVVGGDTINNYIEGDTATSSINDMRSSISSLTNKVASAIDASSSVVEGSSLTNNLSNKVASTVDASSSVNDMRSSISSLTNKVASAIDASSSVVEGSSLTNNLSRASTMSTIVNSLSSFFTAIGGRRALTNVMPTSPSRMILDLLGVHSYGGQRAMGGPVDPLSAYTIGENGPEVFTPTVAGTVQPMSKVMSSDPNVAVSIDMTKNQGTSNPSQALEFGRKVKQAVLDIIQNEQRPGGTLYGSR